MKISTLVSLCVAFCCVKQNLFAQYEVKISGKTCKGTVLTANADKSSLAQLEWKLNGNTVATLGSSKVGVTVAGGNGEGNDSDQLDDPNGVFVDAHNNLWVADTKNARIQLFKPGHNKGITVGANLPNAPTFPTNLFVCADGTVYVADYFESKVKRLTKNGKRWIDVAGQNNDMHLTRGVWVDDEKNVYATDCGHSRVLKFPPHSCVGEVVAGGHGYGSALNQLARPTSVVADDLGNLYITDEDNQRVVKWAPDAKKGEVVAGNGVLNIITGGLHNPIYASAALTKGFTGQSQVILYISDKYNNSVEMWPEGASTGITVAGGNGAGSNPDQLNKPFANFIYNNYLYVADRDNARIQRFDLSSDEINTEFVATKPGIYSVTATFKDGSKIVSNKIQVTGGCEETNAFSANNSSDAVSTQINSGKVLAYPNPAKNNVTVNFSSKQNGKYVFEVSELSGKTLLHKEINALQGINNTRIDVSGFAKGIYLITVIGPDKIKQSIKLNKE